MRRSVIVKGFHCLALFPIVMVFFPGTGLAQDQVSQQNQEQVEPPQDSDWVVTAQSVCRLRCEEQTGVAGGVAGKESATVFHPLGMNRLRLRLGVCEPIIPTEPLVKQDQPPVLRFSWREATGHCRFFLWRRSFVPVGVPGYQR